MFGEEGWEDGYGVIEETPRVDSEPEHSAADFDDSWPLDQPGDEFEALRHKAALQVDPKSLRVHHVEAVQVKTVPHHVSRHRWPRRDNTDF